jgi:glycosyltransferase involved in cell wall biosynthesis
MNKLPSGLSVIVPVYNSAEVLPKLIERLEPVLRKLGTAFEVVLVNDCSRDNSWEVVRQMAARSPWVKGMSLMRNYGQHNALLCGIRTACYDTVVTMDDDLQNPPEEIPRLLAELTRGFDVAYGSPEQEQHGLWRHVASILTKLALQNAMGAQTARFVSAFRAFRTHLRDAFDHYHGPFVSIDVLLTWATTRFTYILVRQDARLAGTSNYTMRKLITHAMNMVTGFSTLPLQVASILGFLFTLFGLGILVLVVGRFLIQGTSVPGFTFLASIIAIFSGVQLFSIGIIGEYLARMHFRMMDRPTYTVCSTTSRP